MVSAHMVAIPEKVRINNAQTIRISYVPQKHACLLKAQSGETIA